MTCRRRQSRRYEVHVFRDPDTCLWVMTDSRRERSCHRTQAAAVRAGIRVAKRRRVEVVTHGRDGRFRSKDSYGNESPRRDTEH